MAHKTPRLLHYMRMFHNFDYPDDPTTLKEMQALVNLYRNYGSIGPVAKEECQRMFRGAIAFRRQLRGIPTRH